jgi:PTS system N-acetylglucosamine-specific IIA component
MEVHAPQPGRLTPLDDVPDPVFATGMVGPGVALAPGRGGPVVAASPVAGTLALAKPHAFLVRAAGADVLVHLGIDTIELRGQGFELFAKAGDVLAVGDPVVRWDPGAVADQGLSSLVVVIAMGAASADLVPVAADGAEVAAGEVLFRWARP